MSPGLPLQQLFGTLEGSLIGRRFENLGFLLAADRKKILNSFIGNSVWVVHDNMQCTPATSREGEGLMRILSLLTVGLAVSAAVISPALALDTILINGKVITGNAR